MCPNKSIIIIIILIKRYIITGNQTDEEPLMQATQIKNRNVQRFNMSPALLLININKICEIMALTKKKVLSTQKKEDLDKQIKIESHFLYYFVQAMSAFTINRKTSVYDIKLGEKIEEILSYPLIST